MNATTELVTGVSPAGDAEPIEYTSTQITWAVIITIGSILVAAATRHYAFAAALLFLTPAALIDIKERLLPDACTLPALGFALIINGFGGAAVDATTGAGVGLVAMMAWFYIRPQSIGLGDVKLVAALGAALGPQLLSVAIMLATLSAVYPMLRNRNRGVDGVGMGPYFLGGALVLTVLVAVIPALGQYFH